jgi:hypothetical protein
LEEVTITFYLIIMLHCQGHECDRSVMDFDVVILSLVSFVTDEREDVQKKTFAKWINSQLLKVSIYSLFPL